MRIRKHAKVSPLVYAAAASSLKAGGTLLQTNVCQLNQSPWDVINFSSSDGLYSASSHPPHLYQVDVDDSFLGNGSFGDSIGAVESIASMKLSCDGDAIKWVSSDAIASAEAIGNGGNDFKDVFCCKTGGKGWQCRKRAQNGQALCHHHLSELNNNNNNNININTNNSNTEPLVRKKSDKSSEPQRRPRLKKGSSSTNPNDFYYYSGFGPRWSRKRGERKQEVHSFNSSIKAKNVEHLELNFEPSTSFQMDYEQFDYIEDEDEEVEEGSKKRARKPIKARSLKSLM